MQKLKCFKESCVDVEGAKLFLHTNEDKAKTCKELQLACRKNEVLKQKQYRGMVGIVVITHNAVQHLPYCLPPLLASSLHPDILVVNSSSSDGTVELAKKMGVKTLVVPRSAFNHGLTREAARKYLGTEIVVMCTPDAYALDSNVLERLIEPLQKEEVAISYARQIPHNPKNIFEAFPREFNYPSESHIRGKEDKAFYGVYTYFNSNSFAAYKNVCLDEIGGFPEVLLGEDTWACARLLEKGYKIAYTADAIVKHSHSYTLSQEFCRSFDIGLARKKQKPWLHSAGKDESRGFSYAKELCKRLCKESPQKLPYALLQMFAKYVGYRLGRSSVSLPVFWKKLFSGQEFYWM
jgi:rhamnosyltransferase